MKYALKELYFTFQGEGALMGRPSVFLRFSGCNLWSGLEKDRHTANCKFCDTDFVGLNGHGGGRFATAMELAGVARSCWPKISGIPRLAVCTGGEPLLQLDCALIECLHSEGFEIAVESNGTIEAPPGIDWLTVSPKSNMPLRQLQGDELKLVYPQEENQPEDFENLNFKIFSLQPKDGPALKKNLEKAIVYCAHHPRWRLSLQAHKILDIS